MTVYSIKLGLLSALWSSCLIGILGGPALTYASDDRRASVSGIVRQELQRPSKYDKLLAQSSNTRPRQTQDETSGGKRKSLHEYGPDELIPQAEESNSSRSRTERQAPSQPRAKKATPLISRSKIEPSPVQTPAASTEPAPAPTIR